MKPEKSKSTLTKSKSSSITKWIPLIIMIILIGVGISFYKNHNNQTFRPIGNTSPTGKNQTHPLQHTNNRLNRKETTPSTQKEIKTLYELDKISQSILYARISYFEVTAKHNIDAAIQWLNLSFELVKEAQTENGSAILEEITKLKGSLKSQQTPDIQQILQGLNTLKESLNYLTIDNTTITEDKDTPETKKSTETQTLWESLLNFCKTQLKHLSTWAKTSISIEHISNDHYHTLESTLSKEFFQTETNKLIQQAKLAAQFNDTQMFQYTCKKMESLITFYIQEPQKKQSLLNQIDNITNMPVTITTPDYADLLTLLNQNTTKQSAPEKKVNTDMPNPSTENIQQTPVKKSNTTDQKVKTPKSRTSTSSDQEKLHSLNIQEITT